MLAKVRPHLTYANVVVTILAFVVLGGGSALAAIVISSNSQVAGGTISGHKPPSGKHPNIIRGSINGADIADRSGVDTCQKPLVAEYGPICAGSDGVARTWDSAFDYCAGYGLRLPSLAEAYELAAKYNAPGVSTGQFFWTDEETYAPKTFQRPDGATVVHVMQDGGTLNNYDFLDGKNQTVCVTDPSA
jgi:hypothetical protein